MKALDLTGLEFGQLRALRPTSVHGKRGWTCQCSCGDFIDVETFQLNAGNVTRCVACRVGEDLRGVRSGKLVVIERDGRVKRRWRWKCRCDCGGSLTTFSRNIQRGSATHCGCMTQENRSRARMLPDHRGAWNKSLGSYAGNAKRKGLSFSLTLEEFKTLCSSPCHYCGSLPEQKQYRGRDSIKANGIDRRDNSVGYVHENCLPCCTLCNYMKKAMSDVEFVGHIRKICTHLREEL